LAKDPHTIEWIEKIINTFDNPEDVKQQVANFAIRILSIVCANEWDFAAIKDLGILEKIQNGIEKHNQLQKPTIKLSHIQLLQSISQHSIGLQWLKQTKSWKLCIQYYESSSTLFIIRESGIFLYNVLRKFSELMKDENLCIEIIEEILKPLIHLSGKRREQTETIINDEKVSKELMPCYKVTNNILTLCIESKTRSRMAYDILSKYRYENNLWIVSDLVWGNSEFLSVMNKGLIIGNFARLGCMDIPSSDTKATDLPFDVHTIHFYNLMMACLIRRAFKQINMLCEMHHQLWYKLGENAPPEVVLENHDLKYGDQVIMIQTLPIILVIKSRYKANDEHINELCTKMFNMSCEHTIRLLYHYRDALMNENPEFIAELAANSIQTILSLKKYLNRDRATLAFQILCYVLKGYVDEPCDDSGERERTCNTQLVLQAPHLLSALLIGMNEMIKNFKFTWSECIESTAIVPLLLVLLNNQNLSARVSSNTFNLNENKVDIDYLYFYSKQLNH
jgi:BRCA1-associated ATM activator 1